MPRVRFAVLFASLALVALLASPRPACAQTPTRRDRHVYRLRWDTDPALISLAATTWGLSELFLGRLVTPTCPCDSAVLIPIDRWVAGRVDRTVATLSDVSLYSFMGLALVTDAIDVAASHGEPTAFLEDAAVIAESVLISGALNQAVKLGTQRPRPLLYGRAAGDPELRVSDDYLSFYSAHTSTAFAAALSLAWTFAARHPTSPARYALFGAATLTGSAIGLMRVLAGKHFPTDVLMGALTGSLVGLLVPYLHTRRLPVAISVSPLADGAVATVAGVL